MPNYQNGKIYTIRCRIDDKLIYVGSTAQKLSQRMTNHRADYKRGMQCSLYNYIIDDNWSDWYIELYEVYPCNSREELHKKEGEIIRQIATINKVIAGRTLKEWKEDNIEIIKEKDKLRSKKYRENNKEKIKQQREDNAEKINQKKKEYRKNNADKIKEYKKKYNERKK